MILDYTVKFHLGDVLQILSNKDILGYYSVKIDFLKLFESYPDVGDKVLCSPVESIPKCNQDLIKAQQNILEFDEYKPLIAKLDYYYLKRNVHARFYGLPVCPELHRTIFPKNVDLGCFLKVTGTVVRVTQAKMLEYQRKYVCVKCKYENIIEAEFENRYILKAPSKCRNDNPKCKCSTFNQVNLVSREHCKDYQEIKIQEQVNKLSIGTIPGSMWVVLENDLVDCCKPGDDVIICGAVRRRWRPSVQTKKSEVELVLQANCIEVSNSQKSEVVSSAPDIKECFDEFWSKYEACPLKGRDQILKGVSPQVYGLHLVKLAVLLTVITGSNHIVDGDEKKVSHDDKHSTRVRGQCHLLLVGDPGTGKSQLLRAGADLTSRSVFTSGAGSTKAGLTCAALREEGEWQLEAGALVLSDGGVCCIDEISQLREHDRTAIHEAMEQQTISIAKAGIVCKLNTRCAIIAACNPKGHYQTDQPLSVNVSLGTPLLSRFDLIFILLDSKNKAWDKLVSSYILFGDGNSSSCKKIWNTEKLQMYISLVGPRTTEITKSANLILQSYYMTQRKSEIRDPSRTTVRMLDSLVRLSQAHCRLMYRTTILPMDAIVAVSLVDLSMQDCTLDNIVDALHSTFQKYPDFDYLCLAKKLLTRLNLNEIWQNELLYYGTLLQVDSKSLESDIESGNPRLFAKYDNVTDDSIPLTASLITSSYFKKNRQDLDSGEKENVHIENVNHVNERLAVTLKKHANLNKDAKKPTDIQKKSKRKRKQVSIDTKKIRNKLAKFNDSRKSDNESDSSNEFHDAQNMLKAVPSVNDVFSDLQINFKFESPDAQISKINACDTESKEINISCKDLRTPEKTLVILETNHINSDQSKDNFNASSKKTSTNKNVNELNQFTFNKKKICNTSINNRDKNMEIDRNQDKTHEASRSENSLNQSKHNFNQNYTTKDNKESSTPIKPDKLKHLALKNNKDVLNESDIDESKEIKDQRLSSTTLNKLQQFTNKQNHEFAKYEEKPTKPVEKRIAKQSSSSSKSLSEGSQISMFESSDCDFDLDI